MKKVGLGILILVVTLALSGIVVAAFSNQTVDAGKENSKAPDLEKIEFIHWKNDFAKPEAAKAIRTPACYKFLISRKLRWNTLPVNYVINPTNPQKLAETFVISAIKDSAETWDRATNKELMNNTYTVDDKATYGIQDYKNSIVFEDYPTPGVIAVTTIWYNPATKSIVEFDIEFDTDWIWGDAAAPGDSEAMDLQNIATHELGHGVGLADVYESACSAVTMYGYSDYGETQKRTIEQSDIRGLQTLYGI